MVNYQNSMIYKLCCKNTDIKEIYIGSTTNFKRRKYNHKSNCLKKNKFKVYEFINENGGWENWDMILIENISCNSKLELLKIERENIEKFKPLLNTHNPSRNRKEYYNDKKENILKKQKEKYNFNKENILKRQKEQYIKNYEKYKNEKIECVCGSIFIKHGKNRHLKTKKHIKFISSHQLV